MAGTTDEKFENINKEVGSLKEDIREILDFLKPDNSEKEINPDTQLILNAIEANAQESKLNKDAILGNYVSQSNKIRDEIRASQRVPTESVETIDEETDGDRKFNRKRDLVLLSCTAISVIFSYISVGKMPWAFSASIGLLLSFIVTDIAVMIIDKFILPGNTIKRISQNANATATFLFGFFIVFIVGTAIGYSVITHNEPTEERTAPSVEQVTIQQDNKPTEQRDTSKQYETSESTKEN